MLGSADLATVLLDLPNISWTGVLYRAASIQALRGFDQDPPTHPQSRILHGYGSPATGARYTPKNGPRSLYLAEDTSTALAESILSGEPSDPALYPPKVVCSVTISLESVLDITGEIIQERLGTSSAELNADWRMRQVRAETVPTQTLGQAAFDCGRFQAIRFPSARVAGKACFVIFNDRLHHPSFIEIYDPGRNLRERIP